MLFEEKPIRLRRSIAVIAAIAGMFLAGYAAPAYAAGTPRSQFWSNINRTGDKLDKDVTSAGDAHIPDLSREGRGCGLFGCGGNWDNMISSLDTTGGGQSPTFLVVYTDIQYGGSCMLVLPNTIVNDLRFIVAINPRTNIQLNWGLDKAISSFEVFTWFPAWTADRCLTYLRDSR